MLRLVLWFLAVFVLLHLLRLVPAIGRVFDVPFLGFFLAAAILSYIVARGGESLSRRRSAARVRRELGAVDTPHQRGKLGAHLLAAGAAREAEGHLAAAAAGDPERLEWSYKLGCARLQSGRPRDAIGPLALVVAREEEHAFGAAVLRLAQAALASGDLELARRELERFERNHGPTPESAWWRGRLAKARGDRGAARAACDEVLRLQSRATGFQRKAGRAWAAKAWFARFL
jgi:hypothetical protein